MLDLKKKTAEQNKMCDEIDKKKRIDIRLYY